MQNLLSEKTLNKTVNVRMELLCSAGFPIFIFLLIFLCPGRIEAREYAPRVLSPHRADAYSMKTFAQYPRWRDLTGDAQVYEIYQYLADPQTGLYPMGVPAWEGVETMPEYAVVRDPVKMINVYPIGHCGTLGPTMAGIMEGMGIGPARTLVLPGLNHVAAEVYYADRWHYLDLDLRAVFRHPDGTLASVAEARADDALWQGPQAPLFFPLDNLTQTRLAYQKTAVHYVHGFQTGGHTMDFILRSGEVFTRWWKPQAGRWNHHSSYGAQPFPRHLLEQEPRGPKSKHASFTVHTHGNGRFVYQPNLTYQSGDFADGVFEARNVRPGLSGLTLQQYGEGYAIFEVRSPYVIAPKVGDLDNTRDDREAATLELNTAHAELVLSLDNGLTWQNLGDANRTFDLTPLVSGHYGYLLKLVLKGKPEAAVVRSLKLITWVQLHPASLPVLHQGTNHLHYVTGDHYGLPTRVLEIRTDGASRKSFLKYLSEPPADFDLSRRTSRIRGPFVVQVPAPPGTRIAWFSAGGSFATHQGSAAANTRNSMAYAVDEPKNFTPFYQAAVPTNNNHWHYNTDVEVKLDSPAKTVYLRYLGDPAVNNLRIYAHCLEDKPFPCSPVVITHAWREKGELKMQKVTLSKPGPYDIVAEAEPENEFVELALPNSKLRNPYPNPYYYPLYWEEPMKLVHARFKGQRGTFAQFGDSITVSRAFWSSLPQSRKNALLEMERAFQTVNQYMQPEGWDGKGPQRGNEGGKTIRWAAANVDTWLNQLNPEVAVLMFGSNDVQDLSVNEYEQSLRNVVKRCLENGTIVILSTFPPRHGFLDKSKQFAESILKLARELNVPLVDYQAEILKRRPLDWDGALDQFKAYHDYEVPILIARDGVHPSHPKAYQGVYSENALYGSGYSLRNYLTVIQYAEVINRLLKADPHPHAHLLK